MKDANVTLDFGYISHNTRTNDQGFASFELAISFIGSEVDVIIQAEGYEDLRYSTRITENGTLELIPSRLKEEEISPPSPPPDDAEDKGFPWGIMVLIIVLSLLLLIAFFQFVIRKKLEKVSGEIEEE